MTTGLQTSGAEDEYSYTDLFPLLVGRIVPPSTMIVSPCHNGAYQQDYRCDENGLHLTYYAASIPSPGEELR